MKPLIGLIPLYDEEKDSYWMLPGYMKMIEDYGAVPIMLPLTSDKAVLLQLADLCDGFILTGGQDVSPKLYGAKRSKNCGEPCNLRDDMEKFILDYAIEYDKSVLGICRGIQFINAHLGGTLYQDLPTEYKSDVEHHMSPPYDRAAHRVTIYENTLLSKIIGAGEIAVNSYHHQAIDDAASELRAEAVSEDGLVEAVSMPDRKFIVGVQWHPEFSYKSDENSVKLIKAFVSSME